MVMSHTIPAVYENGLIRPLEEVVLKEGEEVSVIIGNNDVSAEKARDILASIAALPLENPGDRFSGADHDTVLYPK